MKLLVFLLITTLVEAKDIVYLIRDFPDDYNNNIFNKVDMSKRYCIWNYHWEPNMWWQVKKLLEISSDYELRTPSTKDKSQMFCELRSAKWVIDATVNVQFSYNLDPKKDKWLLDKMAIVIFEPPVVVPSIWSESFHNRVARVFMFDDNLIKKNPKKYHELHFTYYSGVKDITVVPFEQKKLCCTINGNKGSLHPQSLYAKRLEDAKVWDQFYKEDFDFYGTGWPDNYCQTYKGEIPGDKKIECLRKYRFALSYENMHSGCGWVTEHMFSCLEAGCVPVYIGSINIDKYVPSNCYVDRNKFIDNHELYNFLKSMNKEEYEKYIQNIKKYLASPWPDAFSYEHFAKYVVSGLLA